ncbi:MAG: hypothetical protein ACI4N3_02415, partial [Alphaproteobacteria bacterium]
ASVLPNHANADLFKCVACPAGYRCDGKEKYPCPAGTFAPVGSGSCISCAAGTYQDLTGQTSCKSCPLYKCSSPGSTSPDACKTVTIKLYQTHRLNKGGHRSYYYDKEIGKNLFQKGKLSFNCTSTQSVSCCKIPYRDIETKEIRYVDKCDNYKLQNYDCNDTEIYKF